MENKKIKSTATTITLYGERGRELSNICNEHDISATAFFNTIIGAFADGALVIAETDDTRKRINVHDDIFDQLRYSIVLPDGKKVY